MEGALDGIGWGREGEGGQGGAGRGGVVKLFYIPKKPGRSRLIQASISYFSMVVLKFKKI